MGREQSNPRGETLLCSVTAVYIAIDAGEYSGDLNENCFLDFHSLVGRWSRRRCAETISAIFKLPPFPRCSPTAMTYSSPASYPQADSQTNGRLPAADQREKKPEIKQRTKVGKSLCSTQVDMCAGDTVLKETSGTCIYNTCLPAVSLQFRCSHERGKYFSRIWKRIEDECARVGPF